MQRSRFAGTVLGLALGLGMTPAMAQDASDPIEDMKEAIELVGEIQACLMSGLTGEIPADDAEVIRALMLDADRLVRQARKVAYKESRTEQEDLLLRAYAGSALALITEAQDYRLSRGY